MKLLGDRRGREAKSETRKKKMKQENFLEKELA